MHAGFPLDSAAVLLVEVDGLREAVERKPWRSTRCAGCSRASEVRRARDAHERDLLWKARKNAFGAIGRLSPSYYAQDGVIPRRAADRARHMDEVGKATACAIGNVFHAGDGNLHPLILFDQRDPAQFPRAVAAAGEIIDCASR